jgi:hypothetical protein
MFGNSLDNHAYIPLTTYGRMFSRLQSLQVHGKAHDRALFQQTLEQGQMEMRIHHKLKATRTTISASLTFNRPTIRSIGLRAASPQSSRDHFDRL